MALCREIALKIVMGVGCIWQLICGSEMASREMISVQQSVTYYKGRGKYRNLFLKVPASCGNTFLLNPLTVVYTTFLDRRICLDRRRIGRNIILK